jgi:hypothetical protein
MKWVNIGYGEEFEEDDSEDEDYWDEEEEFIEDEW